MNKKFIGTLLSGLLITSSFFLFNNNNKIVKAEKNENIVDTYYKDVDLTLSGQTFIDQLTPIINANYKPHSYSYNNTVLKETDPDPNKPGNIICLYTGRSLREGEWNKEHVWAKSHGFSQSSKQAYCDAHHLRPTLNAINSTRGNKDFGEVPGGSTDGYGNRWNSTTFEPRDAVKGDVARMMFYMVTKYNHIDGTNLELTNKVPTSASTGDGRFGHLDTLIKWNYEDPVDDIERHRNNVVYSYQKNRNPYIDHPEYVDLAFPSQYGNVEVDQAKVDNVITKINQLPSTITLEDKTLINEAKTLYEALNYKEKELVTNYSKLEKAISDLNKLENPGQGEVTPNPETPVNGDKITFDSVADSGYVLDKTLTIGNKKLYVNAMYKAGAKDFRLGHKSSLKLDGKYGQNDISGDVAVIEGMYDVNNLDKVSYKATGQYGTVNNVHLLFKEANATNYTLVETKTYALDLTFNLPKAKTGSFVLVFEGTKPRVVLESIITSSLEETKPDKPVEPELPATNPLADITALESVKFTIAGDTVSEAGYRLGGIFDKSLFDGATDFGVIAVDMNGENKTISSFGNTLDELKENIKSYRHNIISSFNNKAEIDNKYQFAYVINNALDITKLDITYAIYMVKDGKLYISKENTSNFYNALQLTLALDTITEADKVLLNKAIEILK